MSTRAQQYDATVLRREQLSPHLVRLVLGGPGLASFASTGILDEWVGLVVPGQFQSRYYTVRSWSGGELVLDVVVHDVGLVTEWARLDVVGQTVTITEPKGSFAMPADAGWLLLVGDLTAMPAMARIAENVTVPTRIWAEVPDDLGGVPPGLGGRHLAGPARAGGERPGRGGRDDRLAGGRGVLLDGRRVRADAGDPQAPHARAAAAVVGVRRDGLLARRRPAPAAGRRPRPDLAGRQGGRQERRADLGRVRRSEGHR